jgi:hypothetical protein
MWKDKIKEIKSYTKEEKKLKIKKTYSLIILMALFSYFVGICSQNPIVLYTLCALSGIVGVLYFYIGKKPVIRTISILDEEFLKQLEEETLEENN